MSKFLFFCLLWQCQPAFSQNESVPPVAISSQTFGYVDGTRLDSLNAEYATFEWGVDKLFVDYGQLESRKKTSVTNEKGTTLVFITHSIPFTLNFLSFNGWELAQTYYNSHDKMSGFILRKRRDL